MIRMFDNRSLRGGAAARKPLVGSGTALGGVLAATLLLAPAAAAAQAGGECGAPEDGVVTCTPEGNPYPRGVYYDTNEDLTLNLADGVVAQQRVRVDGQDASLTINIAEGASVSGSGFLNSAVEANARGAGDVVIDARGSIASEGFLSNGIRTIADEGSVTITAGDIDSVGGSGVSVSGGTGTVRVETSGQVRAENGAGLFGDSTNTVATVFVLSDGRVEIVNSGLIEQIGDPDDPNGVGLAHGGIDVQADFRPATGIARDVVISGEGSVVASGYGATAIDARGDTISIRQASATARGEFAVAIGASAAGAIAIDVDEAISERSSAIIAVSRGGDVTIAFDTLSAFGLGAYGESATGAVSIEAGDVDIGPDVNGVGGAGVQIKAATRAEANITGTIAGRDSFGVAVESAEQTEVTVADTGAIDVDLDGIHVTTDGSATIVNQGSIASAREDGIEVEVAGDVIIDGAGSIATAGDGGRAVSATGAAIAIRQGSLATTGAGAAGVEAFGTSDVTVDVGSAASAQWDAIDARSSGGDVAIAFDTLSAQGDGAYGESQNGRVTIAAGDAQVEGAASSAVFAVGATEAAVTVEGEVSARRGYGVRIDSAGGASLDVAAGASITGGIDAVNLTSGNEGATIVNAGRIGSATGYAINIFGGPVRIDNIGRIDGAVLLGDRNDRLVNNGVFNAVRDSNFYGGNDLFDNRGTLLVLAGSHHEPGAVRFLGLEQFTNSGTVDLANGRSGDRLVLGGDYRGQDGRLQLDAGDRLIVRGAATGRTLVDAGGLDGLLQSRNIVQAGEGSAADAFTADGVNVGFVEYGVRFNAARNNYALAGVAGDAAYRTARYAEGARQLWYQSSDAWSPHMRALRDGPGGEYTDRLWNQSYGSVHERRGVESRQAGGVATEADIGTTQDYFGRQFGYDLIGGAGRPLTAGVTVGYVDSSLKFRGAAARADFIAVFGGGYAAFRSGPLFANLLGKYDRYWIGARDSFADFEEDLTGSAFGVTGEVGLRFGARRLFVEPVASLSWVRTDVEDLAAAGSTIAFGSDDGMRGKLGFRAGSIPDPRARTRLSFYVGANAVKEFGDGADATLLNNDRAVLIATDPIGLYGEGLMGLTIVGGRMSGFFEGYANVGGREDLRGGGARAGMRMSF
ncbi:MAG TPA: hypothetical protein VF589_03890 [Allosphingosinicella sp.]